MGTPLKIKILKSGFLHLERTKNKEKRVSYDWKIFTQTTEIQQHYTIAVKNSYQVLEEDTNNERFNKFVDATKKAKVDCVPEKSRKKPAIRSSNPRVVQARQKAESAHLEWENNSTEDNKEAWKLALRNLYKAYDNIKEKDLEQHIIDIEKSHGEQQYGEAWRVVNQITGRKKSKEGQVAGTSPEERVATWFTHFKKLLGEPPVVEDPDEEIPNIYENLDIKDDIFTIEEFRRVKSSLKLGKAAGPDEIPPEVFKYCDFDEICLDFCNRALLENDKPDLWSYMNIIPVPKSGDLSNTNNYRGISLICIIAKLYNRLILNRIRSVIDPKLRYNQNGFRPKRTTVAQVLALRRIIEGVKANHLVPTVLTFINFSQAFDSICTAKMMKILIWNTANTL